MTKLCSHVLMNHPDFFFQSESSRHYHDDADELQRKLAELKEKSAMLEEQKGSLFNDFSHANQKIEMLEDSVKTIEGDKQRQVEEFSVRLKEAQDALKVFVRPLKIGLDLKRSQCYVFGTQRFPGNINPSITVVLDKPPNLQNHPNESHFVSPS